VAILYALFVFVAFAVGAAILAAVSYVYDDRLYTVTGGVAYLLHVFVALAALRWLPYGWDIVTYHRTALELLAGQSPNESPLTIAFGWVVASLYSVFGSDIRVVAVFNALLAVLLVVPAAALARLLYPDVRNGYGLRTVALFAPSVFFFTSLPMRDTLALALFVTTLAAIAAALAHRPRAGLAAVPLVAALALLRVELAGLVAAGAGLAGVVAAAERVLDRSVSIPSLVLGVGVTGLLGFVPFSMRYDIGTLNFQLGIRGVGGAAYLDGFRYSSWLDVIATAPVRGLYFQFAPFPLHVNSAFDLVAALTTPLLVVVAAAAARSLSDRTWSTPVGALLGMVYVGGVLGYGLVDANFGTTVRHRVPFVLLLVVFAAPVLEQWWNRLTPQATQWWASLRGRVEVPPGDDGDRPGKEAETPEGGGLREP
jgi:hypothetical protein